MPLPHAELRQLLMPLGFSMLSSFTGGGKSFAVRAVAAAEGRRYLHVPVHSSAHRPLLKRIRRSLASLSETDTLLLHLDISVGVQADLEKWLFEMVVLGSVVDPQDGNAIIFEAPRIRFAIERPIKAIALQLPSMLPHIST